MTDNLYKKKNMNVFEVIFSFSFCGCSNATHSLGFGIGNDLFHLTALNSTLNNPLKIIGCALFALSLVGTLK